MEGGFTTGSSRLDAVLSKLRRVRRSGKGYSACCPAHDDHSPSLYVGPADDGGVKAKCHAGCALVDIAKALEMKPSDFFADNDNGHSNGKGNGHSNGKGNGHAQEERTSLTLAEFAADKRLPVDVLAFYGLRDALRYGCPCVEFEYRRRDGTLARTRERLKIPKPGNFSWKAEGEPPPETIAYEPDLGELARAQHYTVIVEGESDVLTLLYAGIPALGIPGASNTQVLRAEHLEGLEYVLFVNEKDLAGTKFAKEMRKLLAELGFKGEVFELKMPGTAKDPSALYQRDVDGFPAAFRKLLEDTIRPPHLLDAHWKTVGELGLLDAAPAPQEWVLMRPSTDTLGMANPIGLLPRGEVGFLLGPGGLGKSIAMMGLAVSVATGRKWLEHFIVPKPGRVLLVLGEEKLQQAHRRLFEMRSAMRLTDEQAQLVRERVVLMPLSGITAPLVEQEGGHTCETEVVRWLRGRMRSAEWALVIIDPVSRFAGADTECDNVQATRFVQTIETLCSMPGVPTVLLVHHSNKISRVEDAARPSAADARGASALTDAGRWCANLVRRKDGGVALHFTKNNYAEQYDEPVLLERTFSGYLRVESAETKQRRDEALESARAGKEHELRDRVLKLLVKRPGLSKTEVRDALKADRTAVFRLIAELAEDGTLTEGPKNAYRITPQQGDLPDG